MKNNRTITSLMSRQDRVILAFKLVSGESGVVLGAVSGDGVAETLAEVVAALVARYGKRLFKITRLRSR